MLPREWSDGMFAGFDPDDMRPFSLVTFLAFARDPATWTLFRDIATDATVAGYWRGLAAGGMVDQRYGEESARTDRASDRRYLDALQSVLFDLAYGPPLPEFEERTAVWLRDTLGRRFQREYDRVLRDAGRKDGSPA